MEREDIDVIFEQIKSIILNKPIDDDVRTDNDELDDLQEAIFYLSNCLSESNQFLMELSRGNLNAKAPSRHNFLAGSLKELHSGLKYLTWQAKQVANGEYNHRISFLGEFSDSFNSMIEQLDEREKS